MALVPVGQTCAGRLTSQAHAWRWHKVWPFLAQECPQLQLHTMIEPNAMERLDDSRLHMRWQAKPTQPLQRLLKGAEAFSLHLVPPGSPLSVNPEDSR
eukprot:3190589-Amphidinium_carterae.1